MEFNYCCHRWCRSPGEKKQNKRRLQSFIWLAASSPALCVLCVYFWISLYLSLLLIFISHNNSLFLFFSCGAQIRISAKGKSRRMSAIRRPPGNHLAADLCANGGRLEPGSNRNSSVSVIQCSSLVVRHIDLPCWPKSCTLLLLHVLTCVPCDCFFILVIFLFYFSPAVGVVGSFPFFLTSANQPVAGFTHRHPQVSMMSPPRLIHHQCHHHQYTHDLYFLNVGQLYNTCQHLKWLSPYTHMYM